MGMENLAHGDPDGLALTWAKGWPGQVQRWVIAKNLNLNILFKPCQIMQMQRDEEGPQHCCRHSQFSLFSSIFTFSQIFSSSFTCPTFSPKFSLFLTFSPFTCEYISPCSYPIKCLLLRKRLVAEERLQRRRAREEAQCFSPFMFGSIIWKNHFLPDSD